jgi:hypothetical protein
MNRMACLYFISNAGVKARYITYTSLRQLDIYCLDSGEEPSSLKDYVANPGTSIVCSPRILRNALKLCLVLDI